MANKQAAKPSFLWLIFGIVIGICFTYLVSYSVLGWVYSESVTNIFVAIGTIGLALVTVSKDVWPHFFEKRKSQAGAIIGLEESTKSLILSSSVFIEIVDCFLATTNEQYEAACVGIELEQRIRDLEHEHHVWFLEEESEGRRALDQVKADYASYIHSLRIARTRGVVSTFKNEFNTLKMRFEMLAECHSNATQISRRVNDVLSAKAGLDEIDGKGYGLTE